MSCEKLTEYERKRLENIKRNQEMMASYNIHSSLNQLSSARKRTVSKTYKVSPQKKPKSDKPVVMRRSLRARGMPPDCSEGLKDDFDDRSLKAKSPEKQNPSVDYNGSFGFKDVLKGEGSDKGLIEAILAVEGKSEFGCSNRDKGLVKGGFEFEKLALKEENVARVVPGRIMQVRFMPCADMRIVVVGNKYGNIGFWNMDAEGDNDDGLFLYHPHPSPISGISVHGSSLSKIYTSCYDGFIRVMDIGKEVFDLAYSCSNSIFSLSNRPDDVKCLFFGEGRGGLSIWDERMGKPSSEWNLHENRINTIDFNSGNTNIMCTSSTDGTACIWDLRNINAKKPKTVKVVDHRKAVHSAYFSPSGKYLATTSMDNSVGISGGANFECVSMIGHDNQTGRWLSSFRASWGWDDSCIFIGSMKRAVDVISPVEDILAAPVKRSIFSSLHSPHMSAIPCRFAAHPYKVGVLAGATSGGQIYTWTSC